MPLIGNTQRFIYINSRELMYISPANVPEPNSIKQKEDLRSFFWGAEFMDTYRSISISSGSCHVGFK
jgi:hypothetical protein